MATRIQVRRGTNTQWNTTDPILNIGEFGYSTTDSQFKIGDGTTIWSELDYVPSATSLGSSLGDYIELIEKSAADGVAELDGSKNILAPAGIIFEGTANDFETTLSVTDPTADRTITLPNVTGTVITTGNLSDITDIGVFSSTITMEGSTANDFELTLSAGDPTADRTLTFPDATDTLVGRATTDTLTNKTLTSPKINEDVAVTATATELNYVDGVTSAIQTQLNALAPKADPTFTGTISAAALTLSGDLTVNGTTTTINSTTLAVDDKNIVLGDVATPSDVTADGGGITLKGATDKTFNWVDSTDAWTSSEHINLASGKTLKYNGTNLIAAQSGNSGKYLTTDGTSTSWGTVSGYSAPTLGSTTISSGDTVSQIDELTLFNPEILISTGTAGSASFSGTSSRWAGTGNPLLTTSNLSSVPIGATLTVSNTLTSETTVFTTTSVWSAGSVNVTRVSGSTGIDAANNEYPDASSNISATWLPAYNTISSVELKYLDGITSNVQTQLNAISVYSAPTLGSTSIASGATVTTIAGLTLTAPTLTGTVTASGDINLSAAGGPGSVIDELALMLMGAI